MFERNMNLWDTIVTFDVAGIAKDCEDKSEKTEKDFH